MTAVFKHELRSYFNSLTAWLFCAFLLVFVGVGAMLYNIQSAVANFEYVLEFVSPGLIVFIPVLTMRVISEEKKQKTDQLLYSLPLRGSQIILGKYLAILIILLIPICIMSIYPLIFAQFGDVFLPTSYGSLLAFYLMCAALASVGMFISSLTENQGFAAGISIVVILFNYFSVRLAEYVSSTASGSFIVLCLLLLLAGLIIRHLTQNDYLSLGLPAAGIAAACILFLTRQSLFEGLLPDLMEKLSVFERFYGFVNGVFDITSIIFFLTVIVFFLFLSVQSLEKRRYS